MSCGAKCSRPDNGRDTWRWPRRAGRRQGGEVRAQVRRQHLNSRRGEQQQLLVDPELVHALDAARADVHQFILQLPVLREHQRHLQASVVGRGGTGRILDLGSEYLRNVPGLLGGDALVVARAAGALAGAGVACHSGRQRHGGAESRLDY
jgi:hypothetical protein